ncbi:MAG: hypothetical protein ACKVK3_12795 [Acidimicrobiales bacterium]|jgi:hypothetical protein
MSQQAIFIFGVIMFAITVYGTVMAAGLALTRAEIDQDETLQKKVDSEQLEKRLPNVKY